MAHSFSGRAAVIVGLLTVIAANFVYLSGLSAVLDPMMAMEPFYIAMAQRPFLEIVGSSAAWGPMYALWLKPLTICFADPIDVYTANVYALSFGVTVALYLHLWVLTRRVEIAVVGALLFLISDLNVPLASKSSGFALMVVIAGLTLSALSARRESRHALAAIAVSVAAYARPELYPAALGLLALALWAARGSSPSRAVWAAVAVIGGLALAAGVPLYDASAGTDRLLMAVREHFAWNWIRWHGQLQDFRSIWQQQFGGADGLLLAFARSPLAVVRHLADNLVLAVGITVTAACEHYPVVGPPSAPLLVRAEVNLLTLSMLGCVAVAIFRRPTESELRARYDETLLVYALVAALPIAAGIVVFPMVHYLALPAVLLLLTGLLGAALLAPRGNWSTGWVLAGALLCLAVVPRPFVLPSAYRVPGAPFVGEVAVHRPIVDTIALIHALQLAPPVNVLTPTDGIGTLLGPGFHEVRLWQKGDQPLAEYMRANDVGVIVTREIGRDSFVTADPYWGQLQNDPEAAGFRRFLVPDHPQIGVYVRADLLG